jgi:hypothetical protein
MSGASSDSAHAGASARSSYESDRLPYTKTAARRAVRMTIGEELRAHHKVPPDLPHDMLTPLDAVERTG